MSAHIAIDDVWKAYPRAGAANARTLRGVLTGRAPAFSRRGERHWALSGVSLTIERGQSVGVIGQNGAGKSTLLRLAAHVGRPTRGAISVPESTSAVLSLGDTFAMDLTGRENARTLAVVAGLRGRAARAAVDGAIEFAELEDYASAPLRTYSDGMRLRLAFGVVAQLEPEALLLDEVLAVGDLPFQAKCMERVQQLRRGGTTVMFASHDLDTIERECTRAIWLQAGSVRMTGGATEVVDAYRSAMRSASFDRTPTPGPPSGDSDLELRRNRLGSQEVVIDAVRLEPDVVSTGSPLRVTLSLRATQDGVYEPIVGVTIHRRGDGVICYDVSTEADGVRLGAVGPGARSVTLEFERLDLLPGDYVLDVGAYEPGWEYAYDFHWNAYPLEVIGRGGDKGVFRPPHRWTAD